MASIFRRPLNTETLPQWVFSPLVWIGSTAVLSVLIGFSCSPAFAQPLACKAMGLSTLLLIPAALFLIMLARFPEGLLLALCVLPLVSSAIRLPNTSGTLASEKLLILAIIAAWLLARERRGIEWKRFPQGTGFLLSFLAWSGISTLLHGRLEGYWEWMGNVAAICILIILKEVNLTKDKASEWKRHILHAGVAVILIGWIQYGYWRWTQQLLPATYVEGIQRSDSYYYSSTFGHRNYYLAYMLLILFPMLELAFQESRKRALGWGVAFALGYVALWTSWGGGGQVIAAFCLLFIPVALPDRARLRIGLLGLVLLAALFFSTAIPWVTQKYLPGTLYLRVKDSSWYIREKTLLVGFQAFKDRAVLGFGMNSFPEVYSEYVTKTSTGSLDKKYARMLRLPDYASLRQIKSLSSHNFFLRLLVETGIVGFVCFMGGIIMMIRPLFLRPCGGPRPMPRSVTRVGWGAAAGAVALLLMGLAEDVLSSARLFVIFNAVILLGKRATEREGGALS